MWEFQRLNPSSLKRSLFMCPTLSYRLFQCLWDGSVSESAFVVNAVVCFQWRGDVPFNGDAVTVKRRARAGITVSHLYAEASSSFVTLRTLQAELLNLLPGVCYPFEHDSARSCPRRRILIWVLSYSVIGISTIGLSNDRRWRCSGTSTFTFETFLVKPWYTAAQRDSSVVSK